MVVDRLEELLAQVADEDDEEQEDVLALEAERAIPTAPVPGSGGQPESGPESESREETEQGGRETSPVPLGNGGLWATISRAGGEPPAEDDGSAPAHENRLTAARAPRAGAGRAAEGLGPAKPATVAERLWPVEPAAVTEGLRPAEPAAAADAEASPIPGAAAERGLEELYRLTAQASRPAAQSLPAEQAGRTRHAEEPGRTAALTVDELDRAVRRDSRRYDGGITIF